MFDIIEYLNGINCKYKENAFLSEYITFKVGGPCEIMCFPESNDTLIDLIHTFKSESIKYFIIGKGSNLLADDDGFAGVVINTTLLDNIELIDNDTIRCSAGTSLMKVCRFALENSLSGLEFAYGIPGTVGGAVYMNAGAYGGEIKDIIVSCDYIDNDSVITADKESLNLSYRHSCFTDSNNVITSAVFKLNKGNPEDIKSKMNELIGKRKDKQPIEYPSAGSTFKRPEGYFAGALIEECGLKGKSIGGAQVSDKHAGFIINKNKATCQDIKDLISLCQDTVFNMKNVQLETEVKYIK